MAVPMGLCLSGAGVPVQARVVVGRIQFLVAVGRKSLFPCWLSAGSLSCQVPLVVLCHMAPHTR